MKIDLTGADVVDAHCHGFRSQDLLDRDPTAFETRCMFLGTALLSSGHSNHDLAAFAEELTETTMFGLALRRWMADLPRVRAHEGRGGRRSRRRVASRPTRVRARAAGVRADRRGRGRRGLSATDDPASRLRGSARRHPGASGGSHRAVDRARSRGGWLRRRRGGVRGAGARGRERPAPDRATRRSSRTGPGWTSRIRRPRTRRRPSNAGARTAGASPGSTRSRSGISSSGDRSRSRRNTTASSTSTSARGIPT